MSIDPLQKFRDALDEPSQPPPPSPTEDDDHDGGHCHCKRDEVVTIYDDGSYIAFTRGGAALIAWCVLASAVAVYTLASAFWSWLTALNVFGMLLTFVLASGVMTLLILGGNLIVAGWGRLRRARRREGAVQP